MKIKIENENKTFKRAIKVIYDLALSVIYLRTYSSYDSRLD
jgi:hypothetical protein